jgi:hypothetical protein
MERITHGGQSLTVRQWSQITGIRTDRIFHRIEAGWPVTEALTPPRRGRTHVRKRWALTPKQIAAIRASTGGCRDVAARYGICPSSVSRIRRGLTT